jgi:hypothetical protein
MTRAVVMTGTKVDACGVERITIVFLVCTYIDRVLAELSIVSLTFTCTLIDDFHTVTLPLIDVLVAPSSVQARVADALIDTDVAVACE